MVGQDSKGNVKLKIELDMETYSEIPKSHCLIISTFKYIYYINFINKDILKKYHNCSFIILVKESDICNSYVKPNIFCHDFWHSKEVFFANIWENFNNFNYIENRVINESSDWMIEKDKRDG